MAYCKVFSEKCSGEDVCIQLDYDRLSLPKTNETNDIQMKVLDMNILKVNDNECIVKASFWLNIVWHEPRDKSFTSLMAELCQDINRVSSFSRGLNGTFP